MSKYAHITDEKEREAAILAKYGVKPRRALEPKSSSSSLSSMDDDNDEQAINEYIENDLMKSNPLYIVYGDRLKETPKKKTPRNKDQPSSVGMLGNILGQLRGQGSRQNLYSSEESLSMSYSPEEKAQFPGSCSNMKAMFDSRQQQQSMPQARTRAVERSSSYTSVGTLFEQSIKDQVRPQQQHHHHQQQQQQQSAAFKPQVSTVGKVATSIQSQSSSSFESQGFLPGKHSLAKSASFHKFRQSFESGRFEDSDSDYDDMDGPDVVKATSTSEQRSQIQSELAEIRSCPRLQKMFSINRPRSTENLARSNSSSAVYDNLEAANEEGVMSVKEARANIKNIFDGGANKVTFGGGKTLSQVDEERRAKELQEKQQQKKRVQFSDKTWVLETINKYFDVIDEDEEEEYEEDYQGEEGSEDEDYDEEEEEYEMEESPTTFSTQVSAQRFTYPTAMPAQAQPQPSPPDQNHPYPQYRQPEQRKYNPIYYEDDYDDQGSEEDLEEGYEDELEEEYEQDYSEDDDEDQIPYGATALQRSASSSKMRCLFSTVLQKSASGTEFSMDRFKANLGAHLHRRASVTSNNQVDGGDDTSDSDEDEDEDDFQDCSENPVETNKFYRMPL